MITTANDSHHASSFDFAIFWVNDRLFLYIAERDCRYVVQERNEGRRAGSPAKSSDIVDEYATISVSFDVKLRNAVSASQG